MPHVQKALAALPTVALINGYGPTEGTTFTCCFPIASADGIASIPIGRPIANTRGLPPRRAPLAGAGRASPGELYAGGDGVARGYLNRPALTHRAVRPLIPFRALRRRVCTGPAILAAGYRTAPSRFSGAPISR